MGGVKKKRHRQTRTAEGEPNKKMAEKKAIKTHYSDKTKRFAKFLVTSGETLKTVSKRLNIPMSTLAHFSSDGNWIDDRYPSMSPDDLYQACLTLAMESLLTAQDSADAIEKGDCIARAHKLTIMMRSLADIAPLRKATMQGFMKDLIEKDPDNPHLEQILKSAQKYHDALYSQENPAEV